MNSIVQYCNNYLNTNIAYTMDDVITIMALITRTHHHGLCFIFPSIIYYYFGKYFTEKRELTIKRNQNIALKDMLMKEILIWLFILVL